MARLQEKDLHGMADELGKIRAQMANLKERESEIRDAFMEVGIKSLEDSRFRATVVESMRTTINWKKVAEKLNPSHQLVTAHTKQTPVTSIRVSARRGII